MEIKIHNLIFDLPEIYQYSDYRYAAECCCPECSKAGLYYDWLEHNTEGIVGYCVLPDGSHCICLECPKCHTKYRYHYLESWIIEESRIVFDVEQWKHDVGLAMLVKNEKTGEYNKYIRRII